VFVVPREEPEGEVACAICLSTIEHGADRFRFRRKAEESFHSGFRTLSPQGTFAAELQYCRRAACVPRAAFACDEADAYGLMLCVQPCIPQSLRAVLRGARHHA
jgi:hypothetical protein